MKPRNEEGIDWWQVGAVVALAGIVVVDLVVPGRLIAPLAAAAERTGWEEEVEGGAGTRPLPRLPSEVWPVAALVMGVLVMGLAALRMIREQAVEGRWLWILALAAASVLWSAGVLAALHKAEKALAGLSPGI